MAKSATRSNTKKSKKKASNKAKADPTAKEQPTAEGSDKASPKTAWETFIGHWSLPFYGITLAVMIPYFLQQFYLYLILERPDLVMQYSGGRIALRPAVGLTKARPLLVVGTISGATTQVAHDMKDLMNLEVCHENSETTKHYCRDGTVSWFHGIRFLPRVDNSGNDQHFSSLLALCTNFTQNMGFHPLMFRATSGCSLRVEWNKCWARECVDLLHKEWGCALNKEGPPLCETPFATTLHQTRHPLRTTESLVAKFCPAGTMDAGYVRMIQALFPHRNFTEYSCIQAAGYYVLEYHNAMLKAVKEGLIQQSYQVEETTPCQVASWAGLDGFDNNRDVVWKGSRENVVRVCSDPQDGSKGHKPMTSTEYKINDGRIRLEKNDFDDVKLYDELLGLTKMLGYYSTEDIEF